MRFAARRVLAQTLAVTAPRWRNGVENAEQIHAGSGGAWGRMEALQLGAHWISLVSDEVQDPLLATWGNVFCGGKSPRKQGRAPNLRRRRGARRNQPPKPWTHNGKKGPGNASLSESCWKSWRPQEFGNDLKAVQVRGRGLDHVMHMLIIFSLRRIIGSDRHKLTRLM